MTKYNDAVFDALQKEGIKTVILIARWNYYPGESTSFFMPKITYRTDDGTPPGIVFESQLRETVQKLRALGLQVVLVKQVPFQKRSVPENLVNASRFGWDMNRIGVSVAEHLEQQKFVNAVIDSLAGDGVTILDPLPLLRDGDRTLIMRDGKSLYRDADHLSISGSRLLRPLFEPFFQNPTIIAE
jgi:hypothetical protein